MILNKLMLVFPLKVFLLHETLEQLCLNLTAVLCLSSSLVSPASPGRIVASRGKSGKDSLQSFN